MAVAAQREEQAPLHMQQCIVVVIAGTTMLAVVMVSKQSRQSSSSSSSDSSALQLTVMHSRHSVCRVQHALCANAHDFTTSYS
jgi:hypothetical protein